MEFSSPDIDIWYHFMHHSVPEKSTWDPWIYYLQEILFLEKQVEKAGYHMMPNMMLEHLCGQANLILDGNVGGQPR